MVPILTNCFLQDPWVEKGAPLNEAGFSSFSDVAFPAVAVLAEHLAVLKTPHLSDAGVCFTGSA